MSLQTKALVSARWLSEAMKTRAGASVRLLDASWYLPKLKRNSASDFKKRHIPGAAYFDLDRCSDRTSPLDHMLPPAGAFAEYVSRLGVSNDAHVVVYDASEQGAFSAPRVWWMFRVFGHGAVSVLDGGLKRWMQEGYPVTEEREKPEPADYRATLNRSWVKTYEDILGNIDTKEFQLVDARPAGRFRGRDPEPRDNTEPGHIPGSISIPFTSLLASSGLFLPPEQLRALFQQAGVDLQHPLCVTCGSAVTACHVALAAHVCGQPNVSIYDGGWSEFYTRAAPEDVISEGRGKHR
ncbi:3-mercaptopyruvate sulfurtransferase [Pangasianodon hypophthalmus]|uniref:3-mercaptopyruvate sulfurtransferase n=1 Tax=Pangasianodon hypophthalmus TaxID=310915 RepID=UPI000EFE933F|nr:3-mercaptopyruvate sulfurtransferase [Pangasianodon hypophthalmus]